MVSLYSFTHFLVDFACAFFMFFYITKSPDRYLCVLLYNFFAFAMQMPLGICADKLDKNYLLACSGCLVVAAACALFPVPVLAAVLLGSGNAMFHLGGGIDVLNISEEKSGALGIFVSPGAFGVYFGTMLGRGDINFAAAILLALFTSAVFIFVFYKKQSAAYVSNAEFSLGSAAPGGTTVAVVCLFIVVCLRSYTGLALNFPWKSAGLWGVVLVCAVVFGKNAGGLLSDRFGPQKTSLLSLGLAAALFFFAKMPLFGVAAVFLFNMTMPVTLWVIAKIFPGAKGFSFGLLTFALFLGFAPVHLGICIPAGAYRVFALFSAASLALLCAALKKVKL